MTYQLPEAYPHHRHSSKEARQIAQDGLILLTEVGSTVHGTNLATADDLDLMGICLEPVDYVLGLSRVPATFVSAFGGETVIRHIPFEQYERHTAWDRPGGLKERSGPGDVDVLVYSARKWAKLAADGNPTVLIPLFSNKLYLMTEGGHDLRKNAHRFASKTSIKRFLGYLDSQRLAMLPQGHPDRKTAHTNRPELVAEFGYDTKFAAHAARLGFQGVEFATQREITLPMPSQELAIVRDIREGNVELDAVLELTASLVRSLESLLKHAPLPDTADLPWINNWLASSYQKHWRNQAVKDFRNSAEFAELYQAQMAGAVSEFPVEDIR